jgi:hypothetical protein
LDLRERGGASGRHPWELARARFVLETLADSGALRGTPRILDAGAGDAFVAGLLAEQASGARVVAWDAHFSDRDLASLAGARVEATREEPRGPFDAVLLLDVLEHVEDDRRFLARLVAAGAREAVFLVTVPAWPQLFSRHDVALRHFRRYTPRECRELLAGAGLEVTRSGGLFHALLLPRGLAVCAERLRSRRPHPAGPERDSRANSVPTGIGGWRRGRLATDAASAALALDQRVSKLAARAGLDLPGLSFWALCRKAA